MTEPRFEELINLYLDNEIGRHELGELKHAIRDNVLRRQRFERACQLHQAARKALTDRADGAPRANGPNPTGAGASAGAAFVSRPGSSSSGEHSGTRRSAGQDSLKQKQSQAHRNAAISTMAERQLSKGAASSVDMGKVNLESSPLSVSGGRVKAFSFFDSSAGLTVAGAFIVIGVLGLHFLFQAATPNSNEEGEAPTGDSVVSSTGPIDQKELLRELQGSRRGAASPAEAMHASLYESAAGQPAANSVQIDYSSTQTGTASPAAPLPGSTSPNSGAIVTVQISQTSPAAAVNGGVGLVNSSQLQITLPSLAGTPGNQDVQVKMSLPPLVAPPAGSGNPQKSGNETAPPVNLP